MQPHEFGQALCVMPVEALRQAAALSHLTAGDIGKELMKGNLRTFLERALTAHEVRLENRTREELVLITLTRLMERLQVPMRELGTPRAILDAAEDVAVAALHRLRENEKTFRGTTYDDMIRWQVERLVTGAAQKAKHDREAAARMEEALDEWVRQLPEEQQAQLRQQLGVSELTRDVLLRAAQAGVLGGALYATVQAAGFAAYTTLTSMLAGIAGAVGLTLPFAVYAFASSALAILSSPLFFGPVAVITAGVGWWKIAGHLDTHLPATIVALATLQRYAEPDKDSAPALDAVARTWTELRARWQALVDEENKLRQQVATLEEAKRRRQEQQRAATQTRSEAQTLLATLKRAEKTGAGLGDHIRWQQQMAELMQASSESAAAAERGMQFLDRDIQTTRARLDQAIREREDFVAAIHPVAKTFEGRS